MSKNPLLFTALLLVFTALPLRAAPGEVWTYEKLKQDADIIVIAGPLAVKDTGEKTVLPGIQAVDAKGEKQPVAAIGVETNFTVLVTLKGTLTVNAFVLYHLREAEPPAQRGPGAPQLVSFDPQRNNCYLMFLKKDKDGRYVSVTGQLDPAIAIKDLGPGL